MENMYQYYETDPYIELTGFSGIVYYSFLADLKLAALNNKYDIHSLAFTV
ncbi:MULTISPECIES: hypothetical protein [Metabacillus]|uniref:Uncharacterized protein n=1 Tax=Metabacillus hrfriensis TaxID=3048891 RepID=A0ACD4R978_9BACI|nr:MULTISPECIES: hypothetical protein [Metabacillus]UAL51483.1 hypothetical protein K8L98_20210 [Metabacillus dongyingensis]UOK57391.1 hypothetical protein MGI18_23220 [Bacillus sp. OVS6]USK27785.1 hypothetical protein LIT32_20370 [Bacillus sp. CMF21]WHZ56989.1 hypothetical protein QLQ22_20355 [Metabacillus sp. CT-WN-B3]